jgi:hypothetical protein
VFAAHRYSDVLQAATMGTVGVVDQFLLQESTQRVVQLRAAVRLHEGSLLVANKRTTKRAGMCSTRTSVVVLRERTNHNLVEDDMRAGGHLGRMETILGPKVYLPRLALRIWVTVRDARGMCFMHHLEQRFVFRTRSFTSVGTKYRRALPGKV